ncbi:ABC transporter ATP-binding protein/permease [Paenibacillus sp. ACRSA]|uniref:ABC transporter ATP-binding protein n=1 Tax=Paenibacillus sp. ACRSA TaxID=2918211 RepID=UPI001EF6AD38|nr:ABC transporter ATP-binding protein [Paenibacillus sp. ACRSA]MCG7379215.1 ABC transporter ATP-binding protein/permease [Paenibacillus sp. ACRSA]
MMKSSREITRVTLEAFMKLIRFDPISSMIIIAIVIYGAFESYLSIIISKQVVDQIFEKNNSYFVINILILLGIQLLNLYLQAISSSRNNRLQIAYSNYTDEALINKISKMDLMSKENPAFNANFSFLRFASGRTYEMFLLCNQLLLRVITLLLGVHFLGSTLVVFAIIAVSVGVLKGVLYYRSVSKRTEINENIESGSVKYQYYFNLITGAEAQKEISAYNSYSFLKTKWREEKEYIDKHKVSLEKLNIITNLRSEMFTVISTALIMFMVASQIRNNTMTIGDYVAVTMAVSVTIINISLLMQDASRLIENYRYMNRAEEVSKEQTKVEIMSAENKQGKPFVFQDSLSVRNLSFRYPNTAENAVDNLSLDIKRGETVAILGENGSGKSTLIKLLLGLYEANREHIFFDEIPVSELDMDEYRQRTVVVFQDFMKYHMNLRENVGMGDIQNMYNNDPNLIAIFKRLGIYDKFTNGLDTKLGYIDPDAINLSGGQWQRVALSRFYAKEDAELIIFDEPTAALDPMTEYLIFKDILELCKSTTSIIISHRVGIARHADQIIVMENGGIAEIGTHEELMRLKKSYYMMWKTQKEWYEEEAQPNYAV